MSIANRFTNARIESAGLTRGDDDGAHNLFQIVGTDGVPIYSEYIYSYLGGNDFNIEIGQFGFLDGRYLGSTVPQRRQRFSAEEASAAEQLIRAFFLSKPDINQFRSARNRFMGGITFRPKWILEEA